MNGNIFHKKMLFFISIFLLPEFYFFPIEWIQMFKQQQQQGDTFGIFFSHSFVCSVWLIYLCFDRVGLVEYTHRKRKRNEILVFRSKHFFCHSFMIETNLLNYINDDWWIIRIFYSVNFRSQWGQARLDQATIFHKKGNYSAKQMNRTVMLATK